MSINFVVNTKALRTNISSWTHEKLKLVRNVLIKSVYCLCARVRVNQTPECDTVMCSSCKRHVLVVLYIR